MRSSDDKRSVWNIGFKMSAVLSVHLLQLGGSLNVKYPFFFFFCIVCFLFQWKCQQWAHNVPVWNTTASSEQMHFNTGLLVKWIIHTCSCYEGEKASGLGASQEKLLHHQDFAAGLSTWLFCLVCQKWSLANLHVRPLWSVWCSKVRISSDNVNHYRTINCGINNDVCVLCVF